MVAALVGHGVLKPMLEARGVVPWTRRDSLGALPLVMIGAAATGVGAMLLADWLFGVCGDIITPAVNVGAGTVALFAGLFTLRLGLLALRKLT